MPALCKDYVKEHAFIIKIAFEPPAQIELTSTKGA